MPTTPADRVPAAFLSIGGAALLAHTRTLDALIRTAASRFPILAAVTPRELAAEQARLVSAWKRGDEASPRWTPPSLERKALADIRRGVELACVTTAAALSSAAPEIARSGWLDVYHARLLELRAELALVDAAFTGEVCAAADVRFGFDTEEDVREADAMVARWLVEPVSSGDETIRTDDDGDPRSLLSRMRARLSELALPVRVLVRDRVGSLAAAGDGIVIVAAGRRISLPETERVVLHEIEGHVLPRERGRSVAPGINTLGSALASEDEEGRALFLEERAGLLSSSRRRSLAARHRAARLVVAGATFVEVVRALRAMGEHELGVEDALAITSRVMRGAHPRGADVVYGVARERVYLPALVRVRRAVEKDPPLLDRLGCRRLSLAAWRALV